MTSDERKRGEDSLGTEIVSDLGCDHYPRFSGGCGYGEVDRCRRGTEEGEVVVHSFPPGSGIELGIVGLLVGG